ELDRENQEKKETIATLEERLKELQRQLENALRAHPASASASASASPGSSKSASASSGRSKSASASSGRSKSVSPAPSEEPEIPATVTVDAEGKKVRVQLSTDLLFAPGSARISRAGRRALNQISTVLQ